MGFSRQEYWSGLPFPSPRDLPDPGIKPRSSTLQVDSLLSEPPGKEKVTQRGSCHTIAHRMTSSRMGGTGNIETQERPQSRKFRFGPSCPKAVIVMRDQWQAAAGEQSLPPMGVPQWHTPSSTDCPHRAKQGSFKSNWTMIQALWGLLLFSPPLLASKILNNLPASLPDSPPAFQFHLQRPSVSLRPGSPSVQLLSHVRLCDPMDCSMPGFPVHHWLPELVQTHDHRLGNAIQPSHPLLSPSPPAFNLFQHLLLSQISQTEIQVQCHIPRGPVTKLSISFNSPSPTLGRSVPHPSTPHAFSVEKRAQKA